jgi:hypothetical protein
MAASLGDRAPRIEERNGETVWVCDGKVWGGWRGGPRADGRAKRKGPIITALDRGGLVDESECRPAVARLRLADMDRDAVHAHVMYGPVFSIQTDDPALRAECYRVYNDWLAEFCSAAPDRLLGVPMLPESPEAATTELLRLAKKGRCRQANLQIANLRPRLDDASWEAFWLALEETGQILSFYVAVFAPNLATPPRASRPAVLPRPNQSSSSFSIRSSISLPGAFSTAIRNCASSWRRADWAGCPGVVQELDHRYERLWEAKAFWDQKGGIALRLRPSELFKRQIYATFQEDPVALSLLPFFGDGHVLWASDYPHPDTT